MICEFGDVAVIPFPFVDRVIRKMRPAVVLSAGAFNDDSGQSILAMVTTAKRSAWPSDVPIVDLRSAGLSQPSHIRWKVFTLPNELILRLAGKLGAADRKAVAESMAKIFPNRD